MWHGLHQGLMKMREVDETLADQVSIEVEFLNGLSRTAYIWNNVFKPRAWGKQFREPICSRRTNIFGSAVDLAFFFPINCEEFTNIFLNIPWK
jgi:hypothetical protein